jgi:hypothetical protein
MGVKTSEELLWLALMLRWENAGVPDGDSCTLDGKPAINSQIERMAYILKKLGAGADEGRFRTLGRPYPPPGRSLLHLQEFVLDGES